MKNEWGDALQKNVLSFLIFVWMADGRELGVCKTADSGWNVIFFCKSKKRQKIDKLHKSLLILLFLFTFGKNGMCKLLDLNCLHPGSSTKSHVFNLVNLTGFIPLPKGGH